MKGLGIKAILSFVVIGSLTVLTLWVVTTIHAKDKESITNSGNTTVSAGCMACHQGEPA